MSKMLTNASEYEAPEYDLDDLLDDEIAPDSASLAGLYDTDEDEGEGEFEGLGYVGLGKARKGRKRRSRGRRRARRVRARRARKARKSRRPSRKAKVRRARRRRSRRSLASLAALAAKPKRRRSRRRKSARRTVISIKMPKARRARRRRSRRLSGTGTAGFGRALGKLADTVALQSLSGLGKAGRKRRKSRRRKARAARRVRAARRRRKASRKASRRGRRRVRRARRSYRSMSGAGWGLGSMGRMGANLADAEVAASWPIVGPFQYLVSGAGLEAIGGVTLAGIVQPIIRQGLFGKLLGMDMAEPGMMGMLKRFASVALSSIAMWEIGRLLGSGNLAKFGAFYALGRGIEEGITKPYILKNIPGIPGLSGYGLGQARIPDQDELRGMGYLSQARIPDQDELRGLSQRIVTEEELLGTVGEGGDDEESNVF